MGLDDVLLLSYPCGESQPTGVQGEGCGGRGSCLVGGPRPSSHRGSIPAAKAPHFSRLGDVEVNAGQNASFQCMAAGRAAEAERFLLQVRGWQGPYQGGRGFLLGLGFLTGCWIIPAFSSIHTQASLPSPRLCSALLGALITLRAEGGSRIPRPLSIRGRDHIALITFLSTPSCGGELVPGVLVSAKWGQDIQYSPRPGQSEMGTVPPRHS